MVEAVVGNLEELKEPKDDKGEKVGEKVEE